MFDLYRLTVVRRRGGRKDYQMERALNEAGECKTLESAVQLAIQTGPGLYRVCDAHGNRLSVRVHGLEAHAKILGRLRVVGGDQ